MSVLLISVVLTAHDLLEIFVLIESLEANLDIYDGGHIRKHPFPFINYEFISPSLLH